MILNSAAAATRLVSPGPVRQPQQRGHRRHRTEPDQHFAPLVLCRPLWVRTKTELRPKIVLTARKHSQFSHRVHTTKIFQNAKLLQHSGGCKDSGREGRGAEGHGEDTRQKHTGSGRRGREVAVGETVTLLHPPLPLVGVSMWIERGHQQNDSLADG